MRDAEGRQRLALKTVGGKRAKEMVTVHVSMEPDVFARVKALVENEDSRSFSRTVGHILRDALSDDAITGEEARVILRGLNALMAEESIADDVMEQIETLTGKLQRAYPELR